MEKQENGRQETGGGFSEPQQRLELLETILDSQDDGSQKRESLLRYCRRQGVEESSAWAELALYSQQGSEGLLWGEREFCFFEKKQKKLRQRIVELIGKLPEATLEDFRALLGLRKHLLERIEYVSELLVYFFLEREKGVCRESQDTFVYTRYLNNKLFSEFSRIDDIVHPSCGIKTLLAQYKTWLYDQALDEEVVV